MTSDLYHVTIVIVTADRLDFFRRNLESVLLATTVCANLKFQIRVVLNGADSKTSDFVKRIENKNIKFYNSKSSLFPGAARNLALADMTSEWIYFIDDDAVIDKEFFVTAMPHFERQDCSFIGGPNISPQNSSSFAIATQLILENPLVCFEIAKRYTRDKGITTIATEESMILCNFFLKSEALGLFKNNQIFETHLAGGEENSLIQKLSFLGKKGLFVSDLFVWHERRKNLLEFCKQMYKYGYGRGLLDFSIVKYEVRHTVFIMLFVVFVFLLLGLVSKLIFGYILYFAFAMVLRSLKWPDRLQIVAGMLIPFLHASYVLGILGGTLSGFKRDAGSTSP